MKRNKPQYFRLNTLAAAVRATLPLLAASAIIAPAFAQDDDESKLADEEIVVRGVRQSLMSAQDIKQHSPSVVDSITAEDLGALMDRSVTEALQRVPGVAINRFAAGRDPDHFSVEGSGVVVRGLTYVRSELNGRDSFTANNGRGLSFADVPPELLAGVDVYKTITADRIEGGIAGSVNLRTRKPFDNEGTVYAFSGEQTYSDFIGDDSPTASILASTRWDTGVG
jgi:TonB-dependent receptor